MVWYMELPDTDDDNDDLEEDDYDDPGCGIPGCDCSFVEYEDDFDSSYDDDDHD